MDSVRDTSTRLRRTFRYPAEDDDSDDSIPEAMDEQEQESFIARLAADNASRNAQFRLVLLALPVLATLPYLALLRLPVPLPSLLGITSLLSTAFLLLRLPPSSTGFAPLDALSRGSSPGSRILPAALQAADGRSPLEMYLPYLNLGLAVVLVLLEMVGGGREKVGGPGWVGLGYLPAAVFAVVLVSKMVMASVDPEAELSALRYEYKGA